MTVINVKIRRLHADALIPAYATEGAAAFDLVAVEDVIIAPGETKKVPLGLAVELPAGYVLYVMMRSGIALKTKLRQSNGIGVIDSDFRGEIAVMFDNTVPLRYAHGSHKNYVGIDGNLRTYDGGKLLVGTYIIRRGERIAQAVIVPVPRVEFSEVDTLGETVRGAGGFGSTGTGV